jgi:hypothetical protein
MIVLTAIEAGELRDQLGRVPVGQRASETMAVSANASTSVTFTDVEKAAVLEVLARRLDDPTGAAFDGLQTLRVALADDLDSS